MTVNNANSQPSSAANQTQAPRRSRGKDRERVLVRSFETVEEFNPYWEAEKRNWAPKDTKDQSKAVVQYYKCKVDKRKGYSCKKLLYVTFPHEDNSVVVETTDDQHTHDPSNLEEASALTARVKAIILEKIALNLNPHRIHVILQNRDDYYVVASGKEQYATDDELWHDFTNHSDPVFTWAAFKLNRFKVHIVRKSCVPGQDHFVCSCFEGGKKHVCAHAVFVMCLPTVDLLSYPPDATATPLVRIGPKRGRPKGSGRPPLAQKQARLAIA